jgi:cardiolipin synthase
MMADLAPSKQALPAPIEVAGHQLIVLPDGPGRLDALLALIEGARETLRILYYIFKDDQAGHAVRDALLAACGRGVRVWVLVDGFGTEDVSDDFFRPLIESECSFCRFQPRLGRRYLLRNHQKLALADGRIVLAGGFNISDDYFGPIESGAWRDLGLWVDGPSTACLGAYFDDVFDWAKRRGRIRELRRMLKRHSNADGPLRWLFGGPTRRLSPWARSAKRDLERAERLDIIAAYFAPSRALLRRIGGVGLRGGMARVLTAAKSDNGATIGAARHTYWRLLKRDVEIYEYQPTKLHTKLIVIDNVVHIGSANFDMRSLYLNLEMMLRIEDEPFARAMRAYVDGEVSDSKRITRALHQRQRSWFNLTKWALCYFVVAVMDYGVTRRLNFGINGR